MFWECNFYFYHLYILNMIILFNFNIKINNINGMKKQSFINSSLSKPSLSTKYTSHQYPSPQKTEFNQTQIKRMQKVFNTLTQNETILYQMREVDRLVQELQTIQFLYNEQIIFHRQRVEDKIPELEESELQIQREKQNIKQKVDRINLSIEEQEQMIEEMKKQSQKHYNQQRKLKNRKKILLQQFQSDPFLQSDKENVDSNINQNLNGEFPKSIIDLIKVQSLNSQLEEKVCDQRSNLKTLNQQFQQKRKKKQTLKAQLMQKLQKKGEKMMESFITSRNR